MKQNVTALLASFFVLLIVTTLVLPGRETPAAVNSFFNLLANSSKTLIGKGTNNVG